MGWFRTKREKELYKQNYNIIKNYNDYIIEEYLGRFYIKYKTIPYDKEILYKKELTSYTIYRMFYDRLSHKDNEFKNIKEAQYWFRLYESARKHYPVY